MGCLCSAPCLQSDDPDPLRSPTADSAASPRTRRGHAVGRASPAGAGTAGRCPAVSSTDGAQDLLSPREVLDLAALVVKGSFPADLDVLTLAAVAIIESAGAPRAVTFNDDIGAASIGLCQMTISSAQWLASVRGYDLYGSAPTRASLEDPRSSLYYCAAYLVTLAAAHAGASGGGGGGAGAGGASSGTLGLGVAGGGEAPTGADVEEFRVRAYHAGPKSWQAEGTAAYWARFLHAKHHLAGLQKALAAAVTNQASGTTMHVVHPGESLAKIAQICNVSVDAILAANPDIPDASCIQANDCIALPVPALLPRLYAIQAGDSSLPAIARAQCVSLSRLLAKNPSVREPLPLPPPGWLLVLPGLRGEGNSCSDNTSEAGSPRVGAWHPPPAPLPQLQQAQVPIPQQRAVVLSTSSTSSRTVSVMGEPSSPTWDHGGGGAVVGRGSLYGAAGGSVGAGGRGLAAPVLMAALF